MFNKLKSSLSITLNRRTNLFVVLSIALVNIALVIIGGTLLFALMPNGFVDVDDAMMINIKMILDAGFIPNGNIIFTAVAIVIVFVGMIVFTGATIGYATNIIGNYMDNVKQGSNKVFLSGHLLIINWNSRAAEIITENFYKDSDVRDILVFVSKDRDEVRNEITRKIYDLKKGSIKIKDVNVFVRNGDPYSFKDLQDAGIERTKTIILLDGEDTPYAVTSDSCYRSQSIRSLMLISQLELINDPTIIIESNDDISREIIDTIILKSSCRIVPISSSRILGRILAQSTILPGINDIYDELMSYYEGKEFYALPTDFEKSSESEALTHYFKTHNSALPVALSGLNNNLLFVLAENKKAAEKASPGVSPRLFDMRLNQKFSYPKKRIIVVGHNSKISEIFDGFSEYISEHGELIHVNFVASNAGIKNIKDASFISKHTLSDNYDHRELSGRVEALLKAENTDSILIISDDSVTREEQDAQALINLVCIQNIITELNVKNVELIVEILNPKHYDIASNYNVNNIIISNMFVSHLVTQIGQSEELFLFYDNLFSYDTQENTSKDEYEVKEIYLKRAGDFFIELPPEMTQKELAYNVYISSPSENRNLVLGKMEIDENGHHRHMFFGEDYDKQKIVLADTDELIVYSVH